jgi:hypothetical protein
LLPESHKKELDELRAAALQAKTSPALEHRRACLGVDWAVRTLWPWALDAIDFGDCAEKARGINSMMDGESAKLGLDVATVIADEVWETIAQHDAPENSVLIVYETISGVMMKVDSDPSGAASDIIESINQASEVGDMFDAPKEGLWRAVLDLGHALVAVGSS